VAGKTPIAMFDLQITEAVGNVGLGSPLRQAQRTRRRAQQAHLAADDPAQRTMKRGKGSPLVAFINATMKPTRYVQDHARLDSCRES